MTYLAVRSIGFKHGYGTPTQYMTIICTGFYTEAAKRLILVSSVIDSSLLGSTISVIWNGYLVQNADTVGAVRKCFYVSKPGVQFESHYSTLVSHSDRSHMYYPRQGRLYLPNMVDALYNTHKNGPECNQNRLASNRRCPLQLFPGCVQLEFVTMDTLWSLPKA